MEVVTTSKAPSFPDHSNSVAEKPSMVASAEKPSYATISQFALPPPSQPTNAR